MNFQIYNDASAADFTVCDYNSQYLIPLETTGNQNGSGCVNVLQRPSDVFSTTQHHDHFNQNKHNITGNTSKNSSIRYISNVEKD